MTERQQTLMKTEKDSSFPYSIQAGSQEDQQTKVLKGFSQNEFFGKFVPKKTFREDPIHPDRNFKLPNHHPSTFLIELREDLASILPEGPLTGKFQEDPVYANHNVEISERLEKELNSKVIREMQHIIKSSSSDEESHVKIFDHDVFSILETKPESAVRFLENLKYKKSLLKDDSLDGLIEQLRNLSKQMKDGLSSVQKIRFVIETGISTSTQLEQKCLHFLRYMSEFEEKLSFKSKQKILNIYVWVTVSNLLEFNRIENLTDKIQELEAELKTPGMRFKNKNKLKSQQRLFTMVKKHFQSFQQHLLLINIPKFSKYPESNQGKQDQANKVPLSKTAEKLEEEKDKILAEVRARMLRMKQEKLLDVKSQRQIANTKSSEVQTRGSSFVEEKKEEIKTSLGRERESLEKEKEEILAHVRARMQRMKQEKLLDVKNQRQNANTETSEVQMGGSSFVDEKNRGNKDPS